MKELAGMSQVKALVQKRFIRIFSGQGRALINCKRHTVVFEKEKEKKWEHVENQTQNLSVCGIFIR